MRPTKDRSQITWTQPDGTPVSCAEKIALLNDNLNLLRQECQDVLEDALLMGCDEKQVRDVLHEVVQTIVNPLKK
ncbi:MAG: hypothetical protein HQ483_13900 [Rhodospirillales bacterium]|nr:hypothetical protein [Rhodospirillales bacterium]